MYIFMFCDCFRLTSQTLYEYDDDDALLVE